MRFPVVLLRTAFVALLCGVTGAQAQLTSITGLFTTGVKNNGALLGNNVKDAHYVVPASSAGAGYTGTSYTVKASQLAPGWTGNTTGARWIVDPKPGNNDGNDPTRPDGTYDYTLSFTMPAGAQLATVSISGTGAAAGSASIYVNGVVVSGQSLTGSGSTNDFTLDAANSAFSSGANTITFRVTNAVAGTATGLLITGFSGSVIVPEPAAWLPVAGAVGTFAVFRWRRRRKTVHRRRRPTPVAG